jgi:hypothetical protein
MSPDDGKHRNHTDPRETPSLWLSAMEVFSDRAHELDEPRRGGPMIPETLAGWTLDVVRALVEQGAFETERFDLNSTSRGCSPRTRTGSGGSDGAWQPSRIARAASWCWA